MMRFFLLPMVFVGFHLYGQDCKLSKILKVDSFKISYSLKWKYFKAKNSHVLVYDEPSNFDRREDIEISFDEFRRAPNAPIPDIDKMMNFFVDVQRKKFEEAGQHWTVAVKQKIDDSFGNRNWKLYQYEMKEISNSKDHVFLRVYISLEMDNAFVITVVEKLPIIKPLQSELTCIIRSFAYGNRKG